MTPMKKRNAAGAAPAHHRDDAGLQRERHQAGAGNAVARCGPDDRQEQEIQVLVLVGADVALEYAPDQAGGEHGIAGRFPRAQDARQAHARTGHHQHPQQRHRHHHADDVADHVTHRRRDECARRHQVRQPQQRHIRRAICRQACKDHDQPAEQPFAAVDQVAPRKNPVQHVAGQAVAQRQLRREQHGKQITCGRMAHHALGHDQRDKPRERDAPSEAQPQDQPHGGVGIPGRDIQGEQRVHEAGPVEQHVQHDKHSSKQPVSGAAGEKWTQLARHPGIMPSQQY
jgi:hypothetical protein